eukprot:9213498-Alexandrium_andersonii.AAC.1
MGVLAIRAQPSSLRTPSSGACTACAMGPTCTSRGACCVPTPGSLQRPRSASTPWASAPRSPLLFSLAAAGHPQQR